MLSPISALAMLLQAARGCTDQGKEIALLKALTKLQLALQCASHARVGQKQHGTSGQPASPLLRAWSWGSGVHPHHASEEEIPTWKSAISDVSQPTLMLSLENAELGIK